MNQLLVILLGVIVVVELVHASEEATNTTDVVISLKEINEMGFKEFLGAQLNRFWDYLVHGSKEEPESTFIGQYSYNIKTIPFKYNPSNSREVFWCWQKNQTNASNADVWWRSNDD